MVRLERPYDTFRMSKIQEKLPKGTLHWTFNFSRARKRKKKEQKFHEKPH